MDSGSLQPPKWLSQPPSAFDVVAGYYPETKPKGDLRLRPCLVLDVLRGQTTGAIACRVSYGTKNLKFVQRKGLDIIVQHAGDLNYIGLSIATRFDLDEENLIVLPWTNEFFGCWSGRSHPKIGSLPESYARDYAFLMAMRQANKK